MTFENVLEVFREYLSEDSSCEVLDTTQGYLVVDWESNKNNWITARLCQTPEQLRDTLRSRWEEFFYRHHPPHAPAYRQGPYCGDGYQRHPGLCRKSR